MLSFSSESQAENDRMNQEDLGVTRVTPYFFKATSWNLMGQDGNDGLENFCQIFLPDFSAKNHQFHHFDPPKRDDRYPGAIRNFPSDIVKSLGVICHPLDHFGPIVWPPSRDMKNDIEWHRMIQFGPKKTLTNS